MNQDSSSVLNGVMLNAYPDSIGENLGDTVALLELPEFKDVFSLFYILPTFFNSDLDRGFSIIDYNINEDLVSEEDLKALNALNIKLKFDIVLNHLSVASPQFQDVLKNGEQSPYKDFFINWNTFWQGHGEMDANGIIIPEAKYLDKLFMRKSGLPILKVGLPDGSEQPYWNTFYQKIEYHNIAINDLQKVEGLTSDQAELICNRVNSAIDSGEDLNAVNFNGLEVYKEQVLAIVHQNRSYLGQMDVNARSSLVWDFYEETLEKLKGFGCRILRLDAFAYLHKEIGQSNFFNTPGTWQYLERIKQIASNNELMVLPEIHAEYGLHLHDEVASKGYQIYDFFLPGLMIHTLETASNTALLKWVRELVSKGYKTVNMLGCHDGIPVLDLKGKDLAGEYREGLLSETEIEHIMQVILERGGRIKNLYSASGKKLSYYQINATFFSALGEVPKKLVLARAIQLFMPGIPQIWYLDLFAGKNDYAAADKAGSGGHKEINRTNLSMDAIRKALKEEVVQSQLHMMRLRNTSKAFNGSLHIESSTEDKLDLKWSFHDDFARLQADLKNFDFIITFTDSGSVETMTF
ncbi:alpha-amylase family glycosyl hydrolase [Aestuariivivens sediminicola]|uniref:alpha-amylase family glycosyl hydrolase n=1 Tax=Aestuariivivens sediminicola TaxID=2913560 RepID=UPI001F55CD8C|nr:alpha-amylase family glycosyl hydrolase [Aestuariivivens sediminicola]